MGPRTVNGKEGSFISRRFVSLQTLKVNLKIPPRRQDEITVATALLTVLERRRAVEGTFPSATPVK